MHPDFNQAQSDATLPNNGPDIVGDWSFHLDASFTRSSQDYTMTPRVSLPDANPPRAIKVEAPSTGSSEKHLEKTCSEPTEPEVCKKILGNSCRNRNRARRHVEPGEMSSTHGRKCVKSVSLFLPVTYSILNCYCSRKAHLKANM